jgi:hypothetical protein
MGSGASDECRILATRNAQLSAPLRFRTVCGIQLNESDFLTTAVTVSIC